MFSFHIGRKSAPGRFPLREKEEKDSLKESQWEAEEQICHKEQLGGSGEEGLPEMASFHLAVKSPL